MRTYVEAMAAAALLVISGCGGDSSELPDDARVSLVLATSLSQKVTNADLVDLEVKVGRAPNATLAVDRIELIRDSVVVATLAEPFKYTWDTAGLRDGAYAFRAEARVDGGFLKSEPLTLTLDRTAPRHISGGAASILTTDPVVVTVTFDEPLGAVAATSVAHLERSDPYTYADLTSELSPDRKTLVLKSTKTPAAGVYRVIVSKSAIVDELGNTAAADFAGVLFVR